MGCRLSAFFLPHGRGDQALGAGLQHVFGAFAHHELEVLDEARGQGVVLLVILVAARPGVGGVEDIRGHALAGLGDVEPEDRVLVVLRLSGASRSARRSAARACARC